jgi:MATE family multidrug resistance protein
VLQLALPLVISTVSWTIMNFIDRIFLLWYSPTAVAASMPAAMLQFMLVCFPLGVASYVNTFISQYNGAGQQEKIGLALSQAIRFALLVTPLFLLAIPFAPLAFKLAGHEPEMIALEVLYFQVLTFGAGAMVLSAAQSAYFTGRGKTAVVMVVDSTAAGLNIAFDYALIFGYWGMPEMGIEGAAWATVAALWIKTAIYHLLIEISPDRAACGIRTGRHFDRALFRRLLRFGGPSGLQMLVEIMAVTLFVILMGRLGQQAMVATTLAFNVNSVAFVPMLGLGIAVSTIVGNQLGNNQPELAARATWTALSLGLIYCGTMTLAYVFVPEMFLLGHDAGNPAEFAAVRAVILVLLRFVAAYCLFDTAAIVFCSALKGAGDTRFILFTALCTAPLPVTIGWIGIDYFGGGLFWCWWVLTGWIVSMSVIYLVRFLGGSWQQMRVIETVPAALLSLPRECAQLPLDTTTEPVGTQLEPA